MAEEVTVLPPSRYVVAGVVVTLSVAPLGVWRENPVGLMELTVPVSLSGNSTTALAVGVDGCDVDDLAE
jgi:hypothetical protein